MSLARDDTGYLNAIAALETSFIKTGTIEKKDAIKEEDISGETVSEPEIVDVFEKNSNSKLNLIEKNQQDYNELEEKKVKLEKINSDLGQIHEVITGNTEEPEEIEDPETNKKKKQAVEKIQQLMSQVNEKQQQISKIQREIQQTISGRVELSAGENVDSVEAEVRDAEKLKQSIIEEVKDKPETVKKMQVKNFDKNLLLAMLSLRQ